MKTAYKILCAPLFLSLFLFLIISPALAYSGGPTNPYSFSAEEGSQSGTVNVMWYDDGNEDQFNLLYGTDPSHFAFGQVKLPDARNAANKFTVGFLTPGTTYYFSLVGIHGTSANSSGPVMAVAAGANMSSANVNQSLTNSMNTQPGIPYDFRVGPSSTPGTVNLIWTDNGTANRYDIVYGTSPGQYVYGVQNIPFEPNNANVFPIGALKPYTTYYFALVAEENGSVILWTNPIAAQAK